MTIEQHNPALDTGGTITLYDPAAMRVREAMRAWLRAWEDMHGLPHSFDTRAERANRDAPDDRYREGGRKR